MKFLSFVKFLLNWEKIEGRKNFQILGLNILDFIVDNPKIKLHVLTVSYQLISFKYLITSRGPY